jgi:hypothetical protein
MCHLQNIDKSEFYLGNQDSTVALVHILVFRVLTPYTTYTTRLQDAKSEQLNTGGKCPDFLRSQHCQLLVSGESGNHRSQTFMRQRMLMLQL